MIRLFSPAKINLFLRIVSKRPDGYHNLSSVFQTISLCDTLTIQLHPHDELTCTDAHLPTDTSNLILKATALFRRKTGLKQGFKIHLIKQIPTQAGLGGGSSNAATTLWACNHLMNTRIPLDTLKQWGSEIGSDIPFFFSEGTAYCTGRGELVAHLPSLTARPLWIVKPRVGLSTPEVYRQLNFVNSEAEISKLHDCEDFLLGQLPYFNDLERPSFELKPELKQLKLDLLERGFETVLMSGSGSAFFCFGQGSLPESEDLTIYPVQFVNRTSCNWYNNAFCNRSSIGL
jgi:4-diphosphocytidyl-2-C-methyl-D-erythritol kinase